MTAELSKAVTSYLDDVHTGESLIKQLFFKSLFEVMENCGRWLSALADHDSLASSWVLLVSRSWEGESLL